MEGGKTCDQVVFQAVNMDHSKGKEPQIVYSCFKDPKNNQLYKIRTTGNEENTNNNNLRLNNVETDVYEETLMSVARLVDKNTNSYGEDEPNTVLPEKTEVLLVRFVGSLLPVSLGTLETVHDMDNLSNRQSGRRMLTIEQTNSLVELESFALEIDLLKREIASFSGKPFVLVYTYGNNSLRNTSDVLDKNKCPYAVTPEIKSLTELVVYLRTLSFIWKKPRSE